MTGLQLRYRPTATPWWSKLFTELNNPNLLAIIYFCAIGLLLTAAFVQWFPNYGAMVAELAQFP